MRPSTSGVWSASGSARPPTCSRASFNRWLTSCDRGIGALALGLGRVSEGGRRQPQASRGGRCTSRRDRSFRFTRSRVHPRRPRRPFVVRRDAGSEGQPAGGVGLRPNPDRVPSEEVDVTVLQSRGPMTRTVADARLLFSVMTATRPNGASAKRRFLVGTAYAGADPACQEACRRAATALEEAGHEIEEIRWNPGPVTEGYGVVRRASMASFPADLSTFGPGIRKLAEEGRSLTAMEYFRAFESATEAANLAVAVPLQTRYDFLLTPTLGLLPMAIERVPPFLGDEWARYVQFVLPVTFARTPAISIPSGLHDGLPVGVQLVGRFAQEYELLDFAEDLERMPGFGFQRPPGLD